MNLRTEVHPSKSPFETDHRQPWMLLGSCFSDSIGHKLLRSGFKVNVNPYGVIYHPLPLVNCLLEIISGKEYSDHDLEMHNGRFFSFSHHGSFSDESKQVVLTKINETIKESRQFLETTRVLVVTLGTAWAYYAIEKEKVVANCHKLPQQFFRKTLTPKEEIVSQWNEMLTRLREFNSELKVVFTVSPVRHWRDGVVENQLSKSVLHLAVNSVIDYNSCSCYFPSYEIMMDDLRDYRFYKEDMLHPSNVAVDYIWEKLQSWCMSESTMSLNKRLAKLNQFMDHRPIHISLEEFEEQKKLLTIRIDEEISSKYRT